MAERKLLLKDKCVDRVRIVTDEDETIAYAGEELGKYLNAVGIATDGGDITISLHIDPNWPNDGYQIRVGEFEIVITGGNKRGVLYGVYGFLTHYAGMAFYTGDLESLGEGDVVVDEDYEYTPVFETRMANWYEAKRSASWNVKNGINANVYAKFEDKMGGLVSYGGQMVHNICAVTNTPSNAQPCLTDPEILKYAIRYCRNRLEKDPSIQILTVSQNDNWNYCKCERCAAVDQEEGSPSGTLLRFVNAIAEDIAEDYPNVIVDTLAYLYTRKPPKITKPLPNVCIRLCSIECCFSHAINDPSCQQNVAFCNDLKGWSEICNRIYIWDYAANFGFYIPTFPNFRVLRENIRFFADHHVKGMFAQGIGCPSGEFGDMKNYLIAQLMMDPYMSRKKYYDLMDGFLKAYYGEGWKYLRAFIDLVTGEATDCQRTLKSSYCGIKLSTYERYEDIIDEWWDKAETLAGDRLDYVQRSRLQWRYTQLMMHPNKEAAEEFVKDVQRWGTVWGDAVGTEIPKRANLELGPEWWWVKHAQLPEA